MKVLIVGYGNIGKHTHKELEKINPCIYDPYVAEYSERKDGFAADIAFICVPTEPRADGSCDISLVEQAAAETNADVIVIKSTIPVGTTDYLTQKYGKNFLMSPEYYGTTQHSEESPDFLILGGDKRHSAKVAQLFYRVKGASFRIRFTDARTAELAKYMENCFLALKVTFCNEFADVAEDYGILPEELRELFIMDARMGDAHTFVLSEQRYYDSHCLNKDVPAFTHIAKGKAPLITKMHEINLERKRLKG